MTDELAQELTPALRGAPYIQAGLHIFPVCWRPGHPDHKRPLPNYPWRRRCTTMMSEWVQDCDEAERLWGIDHVAVAWACGEDGYVLIDLDRHDNIPGFFDAFEWATLRYETHRGWHYVAKFPVEFEPGNGVTALRTSVGREMAAGIDIRGKGGYAIVDTPDGLRHMPVEALDQTLPFPRSDWLEPFNDGQVDHVTKAEIQAFSDRCRHHRQPGSLDGIVTMLSNFDERWPRTKESRHNMLLGMVTQVAIEAKRGYYPFEDGVRTVQAWWKRVVQDPTRDRQPHEWGDALSWAVGRAKQEPDPPTTDPVEAEPHESLDGITSSFLPIDLRPWLDGEQTIIRPDLLTMADDEGGLLYRDRLNEVHGDSGSGKSWLIALAISQDAPLGITNLVVDIEDNPAPLIQRLQQIGVSNEAILNHVCFIHPDDPFSPGAVSLLIEAARDTDARHLWIDSLGEAFGLDGVSENQDDEVTPWIGKVSRRLIAEAGCGVTHIDHIIKNGDAVQNLHPSGSKRKRAAITGASWLLSAVEPFDKGTGGRVRLQVGKDRHGNYKRGVTVAEMELLTGTIPHDSLILRRHREAGLTDDRRLLNAVAAVITVLEKYQGDWLSTNAVAAEAGVQTAKVAGALELALSRGLVDNSEGPRRARLWKYRLPYVDMSFQEWTERDS